jgi:glycosyltransferase involved in cell wall biosynthesis
MKIAFFTDTYRPSLNGVVTSTDTFRRELEELGHEVHVFAPSAPHAGFEPGVTRVASMPLPTEPNCRVALPFPRSLLMQFARSRFDLVHTQTPFGLGIWGAALARMLRKPLVHTYHTFFAEYSHYIRLKGDFGRAFAAQYSRVYCNRCQVVVVPSETFIGVLRSYRVTVPLHVIPTGVSVPADLPRRGEARDLLGLPRDRRILMYAGRIAREKSVDFLLQALAAMGESRPLLVLVGDGPEMQSLKEQTRSLGISGDVRWVGGVPHKTVFDYYTAADVFVFASRTETQGLVVAEALSAGLPVVAVQGPGVSSFVNPASGGFLTEATVEAFLHPLKALLKDPEMREEASINGRRAASRWSSRRQAEKLLALYESLTSGPARPRILRRALQTISLGVGEKLARRRF